MTSSSTFPSRCLKKNVGYIWDAYSLVAFFCDLRLYDSSQLLKTTENRIHRFVNFILMHGAFHFYCNMLVTNYKASTAIGRKQAETLAVKTNFQTLVKFNRPIREVQRNKAPGPRQAFGNWRVITIPLLRLKVPRWSTDVLLTNSIWSTRQAEISFFVNGAGSSFLDCTLLLIIW